MFRNVPGCSMFLVLSTPTETLSVSLCREIDNVFGAVRTCFDHVLSKFSGFSWERILFFNSACVNTSSETQGQIVGARESLNGRKNIARSKVKNGEKSLWGQ